ncbi:MAG TPA: hypothetical protein VFU02_13955, partial [Polyangiaceae bacterium]|nr:hypothetical protein [Polyangiaceae bacterium]
PFEWTLRGAAEELTFVGALALCIVWALVARDHAALWWRQFALAACLFLPVPLLAARWSSLGLFGSGPRWLPVVAVDAALLGVGLMLAAGAFGLRRASARRTRSERTPSVPSLPPLPQVGMLSNIGEAAGGPDA